MAAHRYWRINVTSTQGGTNFVKLGEMEMHSAVGGSNTCSGGTAIDSTEFGGEEAAKAFDGNTATDWGSSGVVTQWLGYDFGSGNDIEIVEVHMYSYPSTSYIPADFTIDWSDDGSSWTTSWSVSAAQSSGWGLGTWATFTNPAFMKRYWRVLSTFSPDAAMNIAEIEMRLVAGGSDQCSGGTGIADSSWSVYTPAKAFDNSNTTLWWSNLTGYSGQWIGYDFGAGQSRDIAEVALRSCAVTVPNHNPQSFDVQHSNDNITWTTAWSVADTTGWLPDTWFPFVSPDAPLTGILGATDTHDTASFAAFGDAFATMAATDTHDNAHFNEQKVAVALDFRSSRPRLGNPTARIPIVYHPAAVGWRSTSPRFGTPEAHLSVIAAADDFVNSSPRFGEPTAAIEDTHFTSHPPRFGTPTAHMHMFIEEPQAFRPASPRFGTPFARQIISTLILGAILPDNIEKNAKGGPVFNTSIFTGSDGTEYRSTNWARNLGRWSINLGFRNEGDEDLLAVQSAFYVARGRAFGFLFHDWSDDTGIAEPIGDIPSSPLFQLQKTYVIGQGSYARKITRPKEGTVTVYNANGSVASGVVVNYKDGTLENATADMTADFEFYVPARFDMDTLHMNVEHDGVVNVEAIDIVEILE